MTGIRFAGEWIHLEGAITKVLAARAFLGYRFGRADLLVRPEPTTEFGRRRGTEIAFVSRAKAPKPELTAIAQEQLPMLTVVPAGVRPFTCSGRAGALAVAEEAGRVDLSRPQMLGALLRERPCPGGYSLDCYLLSDDRDGTSGTRPRLWLVRPSGRVVYTGSAEVGSTEARFAITGAAAPYALPVKVLGTRAANGAVTIETALAGKPATRARKPVAPPLREVTMR